MRKLKNFRLHYNAAIYEVALTILKLGYSKSVVNKVCRCFLNNLSKDNGVSSSFFDSELFMVKKNILLEAIDISTFYQEVASNTLLSINKKQKKSKYVAQSARIYKAVATHTNWDKMLVHDFEEILGILHYELNVPKKQLNKAS